MSWKDSHPSLEPFFNKAVEIAARTDEQPGFRLEGPAAKSSPSYSHPKKSTSSTNPMSFPQKGVTTSTATTTVATSAPHPAAHWLDVGARMAGRQLSDRPSPTPQRKGAPVSSSMTSGASSVARLGVTTPHRVPMTGWTWGVSLWPFYLGLQKRVRRARHGRPCTLNTQTTYPTTRFLPC